jgi:uncharacterized membrane protein YgcG
VAAGSAGSVALTGGGLTPRQQERIEHAIETARRENGLDLSVLVGDLDLPDLSQFRAGAERLHAALGPRSGTAVLLVVAPGQRRVELVTGHGVRRRVPDRVCALAVLSMTTAFAGGDIAGGVVDGVRQIADAAGRREALSPADGKRAELARRDDGVAGSAHAPAVPAGHDEVQTTGH